MADTYTWNKCPSGENTVNARS